MPCSYLFQFLEAARQAASSAGDGAEALFAFEAQALTLKVDIGVRFFSAYDGGCGGGGAVVCGFGR
jgi:hypothetical protein